MSEKAFPPVITGLPEADIPFPGVRGWISQGADHQIVFLDIEPIGEVSPHSHGEQWGFVVEGEMELTIGGNTRRYRAGDTYHIDAGVVHSARFLTRFRAIDFFAEKERYRARP
ncbi:MAG: cupin domain-containing protein [Candidatus Latescibacterota bacterium]|nr:MAG: cupin domain-containing protein [Candidatus Latescibacterota bacterium]